MDDLFALSRRVSALEREVFYAKPPSVAIQSAVQSALVDGIPRRCRVDLATPAEAAIRAAMAAVEAAGADMRLTAAVMALQQALDAVADFVERDAQSAP